jgi:hypothetical protein
LLQIALVPLEEFAAHPVAVAGQLAEEGDPHKLMLNRLSHEVAYRYGSAAGGQGWAGRRLAGRCGQAGCAAARWLVCGAHWQGCGLVHWGRQLEHGTRRQGKQCHAIRPTAQP